MDVDVTSLLIALTSLFAATVNGALGYGYSSITVPISLLMTTSRVLNPALVIVEVVVNLYALVLGRRSIRRVWPQVKPIALGILPGVAVGSLILASISVEWAKFVTYTALLPLILIQAAGLRFPIARIRLIGVPFGAGVGVLYSLTTISGPPLGEGSRAPDPRHPRELPAGDRRHGSRDRRGAPAHGVGRRGRGNGAGQA